MSYKDFVGGKDDHGRSTNKKIKNKGVEVSFYKDMNKKGHYVMKRTLCHENTIYIYIYCIINSKLVNIHMLSPFNLKK